MKLRSQLLVFVGSLFSGLGCKFLLSLFSLNVFSIKGWSNSEPFNLQLILVN